MKRTQGPLFSLVPFALLISSSIIHVLVNNTGGVQQIESSQCLSTDPTIRLIGVADAVPHAPLRIRAVGALTLYAHVWGIIKELGTNHDIGRMTALNPLHHRQQQVLLRIILQTLNSGTALCQLPSGRSTGAVRHAGDLEVAVGRLDGTGRCVRQGARDVTVVALCAAARDQLVLRAVECQ